MAGLNSGHIAFWNLDDIGEPTTFQVNDDEVVACHLIDESSRLLTAASDGLIRCWSAATWHLQWESRVTNPHIRASALSPDARWFVTSDLEAEVQIRDAATGEVRQTIQAKRPLWEVDFDPSGKFLITGDGQLWEVSSGQAIRSFSSTLASPNRFSPDGALIAGVHHRPDGVALIDSMIGRTLRLYPWSDERHITALSFDPSGTRIAAGNEDGRLRIWQCRLPGFKAQYRSSRSWSRQELSVFADHASEILETLQKASVAADFPAALGRLKRLRISPSLTRAPETMDWTLRLGRHGRRAALRGVWQAAEISFGEDLLGESRIASIDSDGETIVSFDQGAFRFWDVRTGNATREIPAPGYGWFPAALSPNQRVALFQNWDYRENWPMLVSDIGSGDTIARLEGNKSESDYALFSPDNRFIITESSDALGLSELAVWETATGRCLHRLGGNDYPILALAATPWLSDVFAPAPSGNVNHWDVPTGRLRRTLSGHSQSVRDMDTNADGSLLVSVAEDNSLRFWNTVAGECVQTLPGRTEYGLGFVRLSRDERIVVHDDGGGSGIVIRDASSGSFLHRISFAASESWAYEGQLSNNGRWFTAGFYNNLIRVWYLDWDIEIPEAADWDEGAKPFLNAFLQRHQPYAGELPVDRDPTEEEIRLALTKSGVPVWDEAEFDGLIEDLRDAGFGWLRPDGVRRELERMAEQYSSQSED